MGLQERKETVDGYQWRCRSQSKDNPHNVVRSVRKGTWFSKSKLAITIILRLTRYWFGKSMNAFVVNDDLMVTSWWMTIFMNSLHPSQRCIHQRNMTKCKRKLGPSNCPHACPFLEDILERRGNGFYRKPFSPISSGRHTVPSWSLTSSTSVGIMLVTNSSFL
ncbi:hypothetical protein TNCV_2075111 [Trichonephila clavipes]|nr:hypothetical protein TNCV_2075111 [Trichonephila clavipes]